MKKFVSVALICFLMLGLFRVNTFATYHDFAGSTTYAFHKVSSGYQKDNTSYLMHIKWTYTDDSRYHKMWFSVLTSTKIEHSRFLLTEMNVDKTFDTSAKKGDTNYLWARREHIIDPGTYIKGRWQP